MNFWAEFSFPYYPHFTSLSSSLDNRSVVCLVYALLKKTPPIYSPGFDRDPFIPIYRDGDFPLPSWASFEVRQQSNGETFVRLVRLTSSSPAENRQPWTEVGENRLEFVKAKLWLQLVDSFYDEFVAQEIITEDRESD